MIRNIVVLNDQDVVTPAMLPPPLNEASAPAPQMARGGVEAGSLPAAGGITGAASIKPLWQIEKQVIEQTIEHCDGNIPRAAALLEISPSTIYRKRQQWESAAADA